MPVEIRVNVTKNLLYITLHGYINEPEAVESTNKFIEGIQKLRPGFVVVSDIRTFKPGTPRAAEEFVRGQLACKEHGMKCIIRIVGDNVLGKMQVQRTTTETGVPSHTVASPEEAERLLAKLGDKAA